MTGNLSNFGPTVLWFELIALIVFVMAAAADYVEEWARRRRMARALRRAQRELGYTDKPW